MKKVLLGCTFVALSACTSVQIKPVSVANNDPVQEVCIVNNSQVTIPNFESIIIKRIQSHNIRTKTIHSVNKNDCQYKLYYTARRSWDLATYLSQADLKLYKNNMLVGSVEFKQGGASPIKWRGVESKMNPLVDKLFAGKGMNNAALAPEQERTLVPQKVNRLD